MPASTLTQAQSSGEATNSDLGGSLGKASSNGMSANSGFARDDSGLRAGLQSQSEMMLDFAKRLQEENCDLQDEAALAMNMMNDLTYKRANVTECVPVASSDHVAEIVGKQGAKIKALRQQTGTYIKTPCRGDEPVFIITGRREDVMVAKAQILSAAEQVSLLRARRSLQQAAMSNAVVANAALANVSVAEAITASNLLAASANLSLPSMQSAAASSLVGVNPTAALMNLNPINLAAINAAASSLTPTANLLQNALLSNLTASSNRSQQATPQPEVSNSQPQSTNSLSDRGASPNAQTQSASSTSGVTPISLATLGGSRVLSRLALASGAAHGNPAALLTALNSGLLAGLPSYTPPGFNLATAKHIAQLRVPERIVGLVVGPRGATIKQIQQKTNTYILTPSKGDRDAVFEIIGTADGCSTAKKEIEDYVLSRTGMTVEQLLAQQSQVRALESFCHSAGLNINQLVASALMRESAGNVDLASLATRASNNTQQSPTASPDHGAKQHDTTHPDPSNVLQNLLASIASLSNVENNQSQGTPAPASNQQRSMASNTNANDALRSYESSWPVSDAPQKSVAQSEVQPHALNGRIGANHNSMFDFVYANLNGLINGADELPATLADREHDAPVWSQSRQNHFGTSIGNSNSFGLVTESSAKVDVNGNVDSGSSERRSGNWKSLLAGLGLDSNFGGPGALSPNAPSNGFGHGLSLGSSLNGYGHAGAANASSESSPECSPTADMFASRDALLSNGSVLHKLNAMRI